MLFAKHGKLQSWTEQQPRWPASNFPWFQYLRFALRTFPWDLLSLPRRLIYDPCSTTSHAMTCSFVLVFPPLSPNDDATAPSTIHPPPCPLLSYLHLLVCYNKISLIFPHLPLFVRSPRLLNEWHWLLSIIIPDSCFETTQRAYISHLHLVVHPLSSAIQTQAFSIDWMAFCDNIPIRWMRRVRIQLFSFLGSGPPLTTWNWIKPFTIDEINFPLDRQENGHNGIKLHEMMTDWHFILLLLLLLLKVSPYSHGSWLWIVQQTTQWLVEGTTRRDDKRLS